MKLAEIMRQWRMARSLHEAGFDVRSIAKEIGIGHTVLYRFESGEQVSADNLRKILAYILGDLKDESK